jgi:hypothetical protein
LGGSPENSAIRNFSFKEKMIYLVPLLLPFPVLAHIGVNHPLGIISIAVQGAVLLWVIWYIIKQARKNKN